MKEGGKNRFGIASFVYGILGIIPPLFLVTLIVLSYSGIFFFIGDLKLIILYSLAIIFSILGIIFYFKQRKIKPTKLALTGLILSIIGLLSVIIILWLSRPVIDRDPPPFPKDCFMLNIEPVKCTLNSGVATITVKRNLGEGEFTNIDAVLFEGSTVIMEGGRNVRKVSPSASGVLTSSNLKEQDTKDFVVTIPENFNVTGASIVLTASTGELCPITTRPASCV